MDFIVVVGGFISLIPGVGNIAALRIVRVLRPLRTLNRLKELRVSAGGCDLPSHPHFRLSWVGDATAAPIPSRRGAQ